MSIFLQTSPPWILKSYEPRRELLKRIAEAIDDKDSACIFVLDGSRMRSKDSFYGEIALKLRFPPYCGHNLNALRECMTDLEWLDCKLYVIVIENADLVLDSEARESFDGFVDTMMAVGEEWGTPVDESSEWHRPAVPFHVVLSYEGSKNEPNWHQLLGIAMVSYRD